MTVLCVCIEVFCICNFMCYVQRVEFKLVLGGGNCAVEKLSIIIIIIITI